MARCKNAAFVISFRLAAKSAFRLAPTFRSDTFVRSNL